MRNSFKINKQKGFTIIEVVIVLAIAGLILMIVFLAIPALQRNSSNTSRRHDAATILSAINECLLQSNYDESYCAVPQNLPITTANLSIFKSTTDPLCPIPAACTNVPGVHYGSSSYNCMSSCTSIPPDIYQANYLFNLKCNDTNDWFIVPPPGSGSSTAYVVTYQYEAGDGSLHYYCQEG